MRLIIVACYLLGLLGIVIFCAYMGMAVGWLVNGGGP